MNFRCIHDDQPLLAPLEAWVAEVICRNSLDNDNDFSAAQIIICVTGHKVKSFTVLRTHLREFYEFLHKILSHYEKKRL